MWRYVAQLGCYTSKGDRLECIFSDLAAATGGEALFGLFLGGVLLTAFYIASNGSIAVPALVLMLTGAVLVPMLPGNVSGIAGTIIILGLAAAVFAALRRYAFTSAT